MTDRPWIERPLGGFDLETTSPDPESARIVSACLVLIEPTGPRLRTWLLNPGIDIPAEAAAIHGITTEQARTEGTDYASGYRDIRRELCRAWENGYAIAMYNGAYDCTVMDRQGRALDWPALHVGLTVDPYVIDRAVDPDRPGPRRLDATIAHYGLPMGDAHTADADALAAARLAWLLGRRHPRIGALTPEQLMNAQTDWHQTHSDNYRDWATRKAAELRDQATALQHRATELTTRAAHTDGSWPLRRVFKHRDNHLQPTNLETVGT
ncbi:exonuclease domain-containing protein [Nocardia pseudobrasiliensis]|uniref:DNA polymerase-3 subunit epsilon n=1 Tax=Nocardia pseudobrasiliensis TaxID=45979 RepID=A0A370I6L1_9NOCA|nr:exonuclease domain-containing protein [Nocardia pseudobrasiliensis]RDI65741.1 DNA polymerase-3 subunit epsilon [Nocardia pseudobrasiliensis]